MPKTAFISLTKETTAKIAMTNNVTGHTEVWATMSDPENVHWCIVAFAYEQGLMPSQVGYTVQYAKKGE